jgi:hypothetical protein
MMCNGTCTDVISDPDNCGGCFNGCNPGEVCQGGNCHCAATSCGDGVCTTLQNNPDDCGTCGNGCNDDEFCTSGACQCRPALTSCNGNCTDLKRDGQNCGACGNDCSSVGANGRCFAGVCMNMLCSSIGATNCGNNGCITNMDFDTDPLNCGGCGNTCRADEICVQGNCVGYFPPPGCTTCPCAACGSSTACCKVGAGAICVSGGACPP